MSRPPTVTLPLVAVTIPQTMLIRVVLPAPFGPSRAKISPCSISRSTPFSASWPPAYLLPRSRIDMTAGMIPPNLLLRRRKRRFLVRFVQLKPVSHEHRHVGEREQEGGGKEAPHLRPEPEGGAGRPPDDLV